MLNSIKRRVTSFRAWLGLCDTASWDEHWSAQHHIRRGHEFGDGKVGMDAVAVAVAALQQHRLAPGSHAGGDVAPAIADHKAAFQIDLMLARALEQQSRLRLSAGASISRVVKASVQAV